MPEGKTSEPGALPAGATREARAARRGQLKIFFGMCPGVGKTYAMLRSAQQLRAAGADVAACCGRGKAAIYRRGRLVRTVREGQIVAALTQTGWRIRGPAGAAARLGLKPTTLESRIKKLGLQRPR